MQQLEKNNQYNFSLSIGGKRVFSRENSSPEELLSVKVFATHPDFSVQPGSIRNLVIEKIETLYSRSGIRNSPCPSGCLLNYQITWSTGLATICGALGLDSLPGFVANALLLLVLLLLAVLAGCLCCCCSCACRNKFKRTEAREAAPDRDLGTPLEEISSNATLREMDDVRGPIDSFDYQSVAYENPNTQYWNYWNRTELDPINFGQETASKPSEIRSLWSWTNQGVNW